MLTTEDVSKPHDLVSSSGKILAAYIGQQPLIDGSSFALYNLYINIPGHPRGTTVSEATLINVALDLIV